MTPDQAWWTAVLGTSLVVALGVAALRLRMWWVEREDVRRAAEDDEPAAGGVSELGAAIDQLTDEIEAGISPPTS